MRSASSMTTKLRTIPVALGLAIVLVLALLVSGPPSADQRTVPRGIGSLIGAWRMTSLEVGTEGNLRPVPYSGQVVFTKAGTMSVQAMNPDPNAADTPYTLNRYEAFYGTVAVNQAGRTFVV